MSSAKTATYGADPHGRNIDTEADIYVGGGDYVYAKTPRRGSGGIIGEAENEQETRRGIVKGVREACDFISENFEEGHLGWGNHEFSPRHFDPRIVEAVVQEYDDVYLHRDELVSVEETGLDVDLVFGGPFEQNTADNILAMKGEDKVTAQDADYDRDALEEVGDYLDKDAEEVTLGDVNDIHQGELSAEQECGYSIWDSLTDIPYVGEKVFEPLQETYESVLERLGYDMDEPDDKALPEIEKTERHGKIEEAAQLQEERFEEVSDALSQAENDTVYVAHGEPNRDGNPKGSLFNKEILEEHGDSISAMFTGHFHEGYEGEVAGVDVHNPGEGGYLEAPGGRIEEGSKYGFEEPRQTPDLDDIEAPEPETPQTLGTGQQGAGHGRATAGA